MGKSIVQALCDSRGAGFRIEHHGTGRGARMSRFLGKGDNYGVW